MSKYKFSERSLSRLKGLNPDLKKVMLRAIEVSKIDFIITEGKRTLARQKKLVAEGKSQTMRSNHLTGNAVDTVPLVQGKVSWDLDDFFPVAKAVQTAAMELGVTIRWGASWTTILNSGKDPKVLYKEYVKVRRRAGRRPFIDAPHFEIRK